MMETNQSVQISPKSTPKLGACQAYLVGRIAARRRMKTADGSYWMTVLKIPAADSFSHPGTVELMSDQSIGSPGEDWSGVVQLPSISGGGLVSWSIVKIPFGGDAVTSTGTTQLQACNEGVEQWPVQSLLLVVALFFAAFSGFRTGYRP
jgi:hypothetical protein